MFVYFLKLFFVSLLKLKHAMSHIYVSPDRQVRKKKISGDPFSLNGKIAVHKGKQNCCSHREQVFLFIVGR